MQSITRHCDQPARSLRVSHVLRRATARAKARPFRSGSEHCQTFFLAAPGCSGRSRSAGSHGGLQYILRIVEGQFALSEVKSHIVHVFRESAAVTQRIDSLTFDDKFSTAQTVHAQCDLATMILKFHDTSMRSKTMAENVLNVLVVKSVRRSK